MDVDITLPDGRTLRGIKVGPCRCPGCKHCGDGCHGRIFEARTWRYRTAGEEDWSERLEIRCAVCMPTEPYKKDWTGERTKEVALARIDMMTGNII